MVCAPFRLSLGGRSLVNRNRLYACRGQLERISVPCLLVAPSNRRSRLRPDLLHERCFDKLGYGPMGLASLWTCRRDQATIVALRCAAEQHELRVAEFDGPVRPFAFRVPANPGPSLTRAPDRSDCRGEGFVRSPLAHGGRPHTCSFSDRKPVLSWSASAVIEESEPPSKVPKPQLPQPKARQVAHFFNIG
jgi:hypothetical protein